MQRKNGDNTSSEAKTLGRGASVAVVVLVALLFGGLAAFLGYPLYQDAHRAARQGKTQNAVVKPVVLTDGQKETAIKAAMLGPQKTGRTGNKKMVQIARGTTGVADEIQHYGPFCSIMVAEPAGWRIYPHAGGSNVATDATPDDWTAAFSGSVGVPMDAPLGQYKLLFSQPNIACDHETEGPGAGEYDEYKVFEFEVIEGGDPAPTRRRKVIMMD